MKTYQAVRAQIAKLEREAEELRRQELKNIIAQVRQAIADYGLTAADLGLAGRGRKAVGRQARAARRTVGEAKYRDPKSGQTWTGRGRPPAWIAQAKNRDAFLIDAPASAPAPNKRAAKAAPPVAKKRAAAKKAAKGRKRRATKTPAVEIESGVAAQ